MSNDKDHNEQLQQKSPKTTFASSLQAGAEAIEWQAKKLKACGDEASALQDSKHALTLRQMAKEAAVIERRQSFHLVSSVDRNDKQ